MDTSSTAMPLTFSNRLNKPFNQGAFFGCISWSKNKPAGSAPHTLGFNGSPTNHHPRKQHKSQTSTMPLSRGSLRIIGWQGIPVMHVIDFAYSAGILISFIHCFKTLVFQRLSAFSVD